MALLYNISTYFFLIVINFAALFNAKARLWVKGRECVFKKLGNALMNIENIAWFHCASLGEFEQGKPIIKAYKKMNLIIKSLNFSYQSEEVFKDLNLNFNSGILNLVSGPSGSGKTTLLNLIAGLEKPSSGLIMLDDDIQSSNDKFIEPENRNIGFIFQDFALFPHLNVKQNIEFSGNRNDELLNKLINKLSIANHLSKYPHELSGGQQQRVSIARALFSEPKILLIDEPISNQDKNNKTEIIRIISEFIKEKEIVCILVSHEEINNVPVETKSFNLS